MVATLQGTQAQTGSCRALFQKECVHWYPWTGLDNTCQPSCQACLKWNISNCRKCLANCIENLTALKSAKLQKLVGLTVCTVLWNALVLTHRHYKRTCSLKSGTPIKSEWHEPVNTERWRSIVDKRSGWLGFGWIWMAWKGDGWVVGGSVISGWKSSSRVPSGTHQCQVLYTGVTNLDGMGFLNYAVLVSLGLGWEGLQYRN